MPAVDINRIDADRGDANSAILKLGQAPLKTPQLGVTEWSPMSAVKDQDRAVGWKQIGQRNRLSVLIRQRELRRFFTDARCLCRKRDLSEHIKSHVGEEREEQNADRDEDRPEHFAAIKLRPSKRPKQTDQQQSGADAKEQKSRPWKITRARELDEKLVTKQAADSDHEANPERPIPFSFHRS